MKNTKKILLVALVLFVVLAAAPFSELAGFELPDFSIDASAKAVPSRGSCGENVTYTYDVDTKKLVISGTGPMSDSISPFSYSDIKTVVIEEGVTSISASAFSNCKSLVDVSMPRSVKKIAYSAFYGCSALEKIAIPYGVETIAESAFASCTNLADITLPDSLTYIDTMAFLSTAYYKNSDNKVDGGIYIGNYLIKVDSSVSKFIVREGTRLIADSAFKSCQSLRAVSIPDSVKYINENAFSYCSLLAEIALPKNIVRIDYNIFYNSALFKIYIPKSVTSIDKYAFSGCSSLKEIYYEGSTANWNSIENISSLKISDKTVYYNHNHEINKVATPATETQDGIIKENCICGYYKDTTLYKVNTIKLKKAECFYTGEAITPVVVVKDSAGNTLQENVDYTVTLPGEINKAGDYNVGIKFINNYSGEKNLALKVYDATEKIGLNKKNVTVAINQYFATVTTITPATAKQTVKYKTADKKIAAVSAKGLIKGVSAGTTKITVTSADGKTETITVTVCNVKLNATSKTMNIGQTSTLKLSNSKFKVSKWSSSDSKIVKVDAKGVITAKAKGTATITAKLTNGIKLTCKVTVKKVSLSATKITVLKYEYKYISLNNALGTVKWSTSNSKVATVTSYGAIKGIAPGTATITATYLGVKYNCTVTVKNQAAITIVDADWIVNSADGIKPQIKICNNTYKDIKYMKIYTEYRNRYGDPAYCEIKNTYKVTLSVASGLSARYIAWFSWDPILYNGHVSRMDIKKIEITYVDNTKETVTINQKWCDRYYYY